MRFTFKSSTCSARVGTIDNVPRLPQLHLETPLPLLYTKGGLVPHLTKDIWEMISKDSFALHMPLTTMSNIQDRLTDYGGTVAEFTGNKNFLTYFNSIDPDEERLSGYQKNYISVWTKNGNAQYDAKSYMNLIGQIKPDMFAILSDGDGSKWTGFKKFTKVLNYYTDLTKKCLEVYENSENMKKSSTLVAPLQGGSNLEARVKCSEIVGDCPAVFGVVVDGLDNYGMKTADLNIEDVKPLIEASLKHIPSDKLRIIHGSWNPKTVLHLIEMGIDVLDTSYPYMISKQGGALNFVNDQKIFNSVVNSVENSSPVKEPSPKKLKLDNQYYFSLKDSKYSTSFEPIISTCTCLTCKKYTRAYVHHLLNVNELSASMLLMIHNMHHYLEFFTTIRMSLKSDNFVEMVRKFDDLYR